MRWIRWTQWDRGGLVGAGQMPLRDVPAKVREFGDKAREIQKETGADHVLYAVKNYGEDDSLEDVKFYLLPMDDEEYDRAVASVPGVVVYAVHAKNMGGPK